MDIKQALKEEIKTLQAQLKRAERSLEAYTAEGGAPKASRAPRTTASSAGSTPNQATAPTTTSPGNLPDRIAAYLVTNGLKSVDELVVALNAPKGQVATTCSRMVRQGKLEKHEHEDRPTTYSAQHEAKGAEPPNPFAQRTN